MGITIDEDFKEKAKIKVIGVGGAGCNALNGMIENHKSIHGVEFIAVNTDSQSLNQSNADLKIQIGNKTTGGLGAGAKPEIGAKAAEEDIEEIKENIDGADMVIITAGMGGGTGTGAAPIIAKVAKEMEILTVSITTTPFAWEGPRRAKHAKQGVKQLTENTDSIIIISNSKIQESLKGKGKVSLSEGFKEADRVLKEAVDGISSLIQEHGIINLDFSDVRTIMSNGGKSYIGIGYGTGETKVEDAVNSAIHDILLDDIDIKGAENALVQVVLGTDSGFDVMEEIQLKIFESLEDENIETNIINGVMEDSSLGDEIRVLVIATNLSDNPKKEIVKEVKATSVIQDPVQEPVIKPKPVMEQPKMESVVTQAETTEEPSFEDINRELSQKLPTQEPLIKVQEDTTTDEIIDSILAEDEDEDEAIKKIIEEVPIKKIEKIVEEEVEDEESLFTLDNISIDNKNSDSTDFPAFLKDSEGSVSSGKKVDRKVLADMYDDRKTIPAFLRKMMD